jgi:DNA-binding NtrC family response regulator
MNSSEKILVCDDDEAICYLLKEQLIGEGYSVETVYDGRIAIENIKKKSYDLVLLDLNMPYLSGEDTLKIIKEYNPSIPVIILTAEAEIKKAIECIKAGAYDFKTKPYEFDELIVSIKRAIEHKELVIEHQILKNKEKQKSGNIVGESQAVKELLSLALKAARSDSNILIEGETGTGKELLAEYIHYNSERKTKPFVVINCAAMPDQLIESELFGYEKGAFTDAKNTKQGLVEIANEGTLFLDEIGEMSLSIQPKLLRFLENGEYRRVGGINPLTSNVRIISATNKNLTEEIEKKLFRRDLLFRLNIITLTVPPLRERKEDIKPLSQFFLQKKSPVRSPAILSHEALQALLHYSFPGNVRELEHIIERAIIFCEANEIKPENLFLTPQKNNSRRDTSSHAENYSTPGLSIEEVEKIHIEKALDNNNWDRVKTAIQLGISQKTLYTKIKKYNIVRE